MKRAWWGLFYLGAVSILSNVAAGFIPRRFPVDRPPFKCYDFERGGRIYDALHIRRWKDRVPDMSRYLPSLPRKALDGRNSGQVRSLIQETCVAELVHVSLMVLAPAVFLWWRDGWAIAAVAAYDLLGNLPFILIQRYNRPRLARLLARLERAEEASCEQVQTV